MVKRPRLAAEVTRAAPSRCEVASQAGHIIVQSKTRGVQAPIPPADGRPV